MFAVHTGARAGEQLALSWADIDWHNHLVVFRRSSTRGIVGPTKRAAAAALARSPALVRIAGGDGGRPDHPGAALDGALDDRDDDAVRAPVSRGGRGLDPNARSARENACEFTAL